MHVNWVRTLKVTGGTFLFLVLVACSTPVSVGPPWIPSAAEVEIISVSRFKVDGHGDVNQVGGAVQINPDDVAFVLSLLSTLTGSTSTSSKQDRRKNVRLRSRDGTECSRWCASVQTGLLLSTTIHRASDGYSLVTRMRSLSVGERSALAGVCNVMDAASHLTIVSTRP
jgi:hypothetical protein